MIDMNQNTKKTKSIFFMIAIISLIALALVLSGCSSAVQKQVSATPAQTGNQVGTPSAPVPTDAPTKTVTSTTDIAINTTKPAEVVQQEVLAQAIADGTYDEKVMYFSPGGQDTMEMSITVKGDVITAASITPIVADGRSTKYINGVNGQLTTLVIGKKINELNIPHNVAGSSLTTAAFKNEIDTLIATY